MCRGLWGRMGGLGWLVICGDRGKDSESWSERKASLPLEFRIIEVNVHISPCTQVCIDTSIDVTLVSRYRLYCRTRLKSPVLGGKYHVSNGNHRAQL